MLNTALDQSFAIPGDASFPLNQAFEAPRDRQDAETLRQYASNCLHYLTLSRSLHSLQVLVAGETGIGYEVIVKAFRRRPHAVKSEHPVFEIQ